MTRDEIQKLRTLIEDKTATDATVLIEGGLLPLGNIDRTSNVLRRVSILAGTSVNGPGGRRDYSLRARQQAASMIEGGKCFLNHTSPDLAFKTRPVQDILGKFVNARYDAARGLVVADLHLTEHHAPMVLALAERLGDRVGLSLVSKGKVSQGADGSELVEELVAVASADLVSDPASTKNLFEAADHDRGRTIREEVLAEVAKVIRRSRGAVEVPPGLHVPLAEAFVGPLSEPTMENAVELRARLAAAVRRA